jgi:hypothetical protein
MATIGRLGVRWASRSSLMRLEVLAGGMCDEN